jgi:hypothetical protein
MRKSSKAVSLVLIGSTFLFFGCNQQPGQQVCNQVGPDGKPSPTCSGSSRVHGGHIRTSSGMVTGTRTTETSTGGFGAHGSSSSSAVS